MSVLLFEDVFFSYGSVEVLKGASFEVNSGEIIGIIGPNGGGKTTALKLMLGFLTPKRGKISALGKTPVSARTSIGYVPQHSAYDKDFPISVLEVVLTGSLTKLNWLGYLPQSEKMRGLALLKEVGLEGLESRPFGTLSGGQAQKVLIARALICDPKVLLLDEPTANVDAQSEEAIFRYLTSLKGKKTIVIVTHNFDAVVKNVDRVLCFQHNVSSILPKDVCEHFSMGMYHKVREKPHD